MESQNQPIQAQPSAPVQPATQPVKEIIGPDLNKPKPFKNLSLILAAIGVVVVIAAVGYFLVVKLGKTETQKPVTPSSTPTPTVVSKLPIGEGDASTVALEEQGNSDEIADIEADLNSTDLAEIDQELADIESELSLP